MALDDMSEGLLQVTNHRDHPTNKAYKVFFFRKKEEADYFEILIAEKNIKFEKGSEETEKGKLYLYGIRKTDLQTVIKLNYIAIGKYRNPIFSNPSVKYILFAFIVVMIIFIAISYYKNNY
tara:strand:- start:296 stop:658 length:363 start_codon:yes stop_codon:yes gene_type:complete